MAINPNTDFTAGAILTASQQNRFPRGIVALTVSNTSSAAITTETATLTSSSFTAVANRYYKITYFEPVLQVPFGAAPSFITARIRLTNVSGTIYQYADMEPIVSTGSDGQMMTMIAVTTLAAGATTLCGTLARTGSGDVTAFANANARRFIMVEDIGPA